MGGSGGVGSLTMTPCAPRLQGADEDMSADCRHGGPRRQMTPAALAQGGCLAAWQGVRGGKGGKAASARMWGMARHTAFGSALSAPARCLFEGSFVRIERTPQCQTEA